MGVVKPRQGFLKGLRKICDDNGNLLIFDEVITGFRVSFGGAQSLYNVTPDLTCLGKIIGGGLPVGAYGGRQDIMKMVSPLGPIYQAGTLSGNPLAVAAGIACIKELHKPGTYEKLEELGHRTETGLNQAAKEAGLNVHINRVGSMFTLFFTNEEVANWSNASSSNTVLYSNYFHSLLTNGIYIAPSQFECGFVSLMHTFDDVDEMSAKAKSIFVDLQEN